jgi:hypothetical protein
MTRLALDKTSGTLLTKISAPTALNRLTRGMKVQVAMTAPGQDAKNPMSADFVRRALWAALYVADHEVADGAGEAISFAATRRFGPDCGGSFGNCVAGAALVISFSAGEMWSPGP